MDKLYIFSLEKVIFVFLLCLLCLDITAQSGMVTAGADATDSGGSVSYSIGQMHYVGTSAQGDNVSPGVQQPYELLFVSSEVLVIEHYSGKMLICDNHEGRFTTFTWFKDGDEVGSRNYYYENAGLNGVYHLQVTDKDGKVYSSRRFSYTLSEVSNRSLSVYPVPAVKGEDIHFFLSDEDKRGETHTAMVRIYDSTGKLVHTQKMDVNLPLSVSTSSFLRGTYIVKVDDLFSKLMVQ